MAAPSVPTTPSPWTLGTQSRSRRTAERIVAAALELLDARSFEELTVTDIAQRAGVSVGGFYARFPGKEALLAYLNGTVIEGLLERARRLFAPEVTADLGARAVIERYVAMAVHGFRRHRRVLQQVSLRSRTSADASFRLRIQEANRVLHDLFRARLGERLAELAHPDPRTAIDIALTAVSGAMREYVLFQELRPQFEPVADERLIAELTDLFCAYVRIDDDA